MKVLLRLRHGVCPDRELSVVSYQQSELSCQRSPISYGAKLWLIPKTLYLQSIIQLSAISDQPSALHSWLPAKSRLIPKKKPSAVGNQLSDMSCLVWAVGKLIPKTQYLIPILLLVFVSCGAALAQDVAVKAAPAAKADDLKSNKHEYVTDEHSLKNALKVYPDADFERFPMIKYKPDYDGIQGVKVGDRIPDELWDMPLWVVNSLDGKDTITLREYENDKLLVLDFWASWCGPCVESMNNWNDVAMRTNNEAKVIGFHLDYDYKALPFSKKKEWRIPSAIGDGSKIANRYFFDRDVISRVVWIKDGKLLAITNVTGYDLDTVKKVLNNEAVTIPIDSNWTYFNNNTLNQ